MLNENAKLWVEDLRTTKAPQTKNVLHKVNKENRELDSFCCLGRACIVYNVHNPNNQIIANVRESFDGTIMSYTENGYGSVLPKVVREWLGLQDELGTFIDNYIHSSLAEKNDNGYSFSAIADIIESEPEELFI